MIPRKSEFAQKLLDDLKLRKERIASGTMLSNGQSHIPMVVSQVPDAHCESIKCHQRNTRVAMANKTGTYKRSDTHRRSSSCGGSFGSEQSSNQLVNFSHNQDAKKMGNVSAAVMDSSMLSFLQQITNGSVTDFRDSISTFHSNEVSSGAQKVTNIIAACSGKRKAGKYSIEIGKELFRSAKDLVESLTMLTGLQEAADIMTTHRKSRKKLLECDEGSNGDNPVTLEKQKQIDKQRCTSVRLTHITGRRPPNSSCKLKQEKRGLPNIIAKLMGLVEVSQHSDSENEMRRESETKLKPISHSADDSRKTNKRCDQFSETRIVKNIPENKMQRIDSLSSKRSKSANDRKQNNIVRRAPMSDQNTTAILPRRKSSHNQQMRKVDKIGQRSGRNGLHKKDNSHQTEHQYHETRQHRNRKSVTGSAEVSSVTTRHIVNPNDDTSCLSTGNKAADEVGTGSRTSNTQWPDSLQATEQKSDETKGLYKLNEEETKLKCQLILRNTAETLFNMNISVADKQECDYTEHKDILEAAYEIMERKSRRRDELIKFNPLSFLKVESLNELVKKLNKDIQTLRCYGGVWSDDIGAYLLKMVERDMYGTEPDINCMWEFGWNSDRCFSLAEKDGTVEEVEKCLVDDLLDDLLHDL